ncbi:MAG TPA: hypothetical protein VGL93_19495 [Streptosporangiaceae bacterium]|jgi:hypothetical protein
MGAGDGYLDTEVSMPTPVKTVRVLLYILAGFTVLLVVSALVYAGVTAELLGYLTWFAWPGIVGFVVALRLGHPGRVKFWLLVVVSAIDIVNSVSELGGGDPRGITSLILPVLILVFLLRRPSRTYFLHREKSEETA